MPYVCIHVLNVGGAVVGGGFLNFSVGFGGRGREGFEYLESIAECIVCYPTGSSPYGAKLTYGLPYGATLNLRANFGPVG